MATTHPISEALNQIMNGIVSSSYSPHFLLGNFSHSSCAMFKTFLLCGTQSV